MIGPPQGEQHCHDFLDALPDGVVVLREERFLFANPAALRLYGVDSLEQLREQAVPDRLHADCREEVQARIGQAMAEDRPFRLTLRLLRQGGEVLPVEASVNIIPYEGGTALLAVLRDRSAGPWEGGALQSGARECCDLGRSTACPQAVPWLERIAATTPDIIFVFDVLRHRSVYANRNLLQILGYDSEDLRQMGNILQEVIAPEDLEATEAFYRGLEDARPGELRVFSHRSLHKDGSIRWLESRMTPFSWDEHGRLREIIGISSDITARKRDEEALAHLTQFPEQNPNPVLRITLDGTLIYRNGAARDWLAGRWGWQDGDPLPESVGEMVAMINRHGSPVEAEVEGRNGRLFWFDAVQPAGEEYVNLYGRDITERKAAEQQLAASLREKEGLLHEIHHRVKNNLQVISSLVSLQANTTDDPGLQAVFDEVRDRIRSIALVHEKLYQSNELALLDFAEYASSLLHYLWRIHGGGPTTVRLNLEMQPVALPVGAAVPCGLILNELACNALKHAFHNMREGQVTVGLELDEDGENVRLRVRDNGVGMPEGFDWRQAQSLGLRLVQILAEQLDGSVEVIRSPGTEFSVVFPATSEEAEGG